MPCNIIPVIDALKKFGSDKSKPEIIMMRVFRNLKSILNTQTGVHHLMKYGRIYNL